MLPKGLLKQHASPLALFFCILDGFVLLFSGELAYYLRFGTLLISLLYQGAVILGVFLAIIVFSFLNVYAASNKNFFEQAWQLMQALFYTALLILGCAFFLKQGASYSRLWLMIWMSISLFLLLFCRYITLRCLRFMRKQGLYERRVIVMGTSDVGRQLVSAVMHGQLWTGWRIVAFIADDIDLAAVMPTIDTVPVLKTPDDLNDYLISQAIDEVWLALPWQSMTRINDLVHTLSDQPITIRLIIDLLGFTLSRSAMIDIAGYPVVNIHSTPMIGVSWLLKTLEDKILALCILICISPIFVLIALAVKCSSAGPILFRQKRIGWNGHEFEMLKFRTMPIDAEKHTGPVWTTQEDRRATHIGKWLRRTSLDELPQLFNVLKGEMSIVGPRPERKIFVEQFKRHIPLYMQKHLVKAGMTGWAQINGWRGNTSLEKRIQYDLYYIQHWSLGFDLKIIYLTVLRGFIHRNAY